MEEKKPSFFSSTMDGIQGTIKGTLAGGAVGAVAGAAVAAIGALVFPGAAEALASTLTASGIDLAGTLGAIGTATAVGATAGAATLGSVGASAGMVTEIVRGREETQISGEDVANVAKISYAQGISVGHAIAQEQQAEVSTKFRDKIAQQRAQAQQAQKTH